MTFDCALKALFCDQFPKGYLRYVTDENDVDRRIKRRNGRNEIFIKDCMVRPLSTSRIELLTSKLVPLIEKVKRYGLRHSIFNFHKDIYIGEWRDDKKHGLGTFKTKTGKFFYIGEWADGWPEGYGILCKRNNRRYQIVQEGYWKRGKAQGKHVKRFPDGSFYEGDMDQGVREGYGKLWHSDGTYYEGYYSQNLRHGKGMIVYENGNSYTGAWKSNKKQGFGAYQFLNKKQVQLGHWEEDKCTSSWFFNLKFRQSVEQPSEYPMPEKDRPLKHIRRYVELGMKEPEKKDVATQTD